MHRKKLSRFSLVIRALIVLVVSYSTACVSVPLAPLLMPVSRNTSKRFCNTPVSDKTDQTRAGTYAVADFASSLSLVAELS